MADEEFSDADLDTLGSTEQHDRYQALDRLQRTDQLTLPGLEQLSDAELVYLSGHRHWIESEHDHATAGDRAALERETLGTQQKVRGNAWRAKDLLDHRLANRQVAALEQSNAAVVESNRHMHTTAEATRRLALATIALVAVTVLVGLVTLFRKPAVTVRPEVKVSVETPESTTTTVRSRP